MGLVMLCPLQLQASGQLLLFLLCGPLCSGSGFLPSFSPSSTLYAALSLVPRLAVSDLELFFAKFMKYSHRVQGHYLATVARPSFSLPSQNAPCTRYVA